MAVYSNKFIEIDPENCSLDELQSAIVKMQNLSDYYESKQLAIKLFINSIYGATASKYFVGYNVDVAESITLQGQDLNHYSENSVNDYFKGVFQSIEEYNKPILVPVVEYAEKYDIQQIKSFIKNDKKSKTQEEVTILPVDIQKIANNELSSDEKDILRNYMIQTTLGEYLGVSYDQIKNFQINDGRLTPSEQLNAKEFPYLKGTESMTIAGDTDSVCGSSLIYYNGEKQPIEEVFNQMKYANFDVVLNLQNGQEIVPGSNQLTKTINDKLDIQNKPIKYIMRHKVSKPLYKIKSSSGREVIVTEDHSCIVYRNGQIATITVKDMNPQEDKLIEICNG